MTRKRQHEDDEVIDIDADDEEVEDEAQEPQPTRRHDGETNVDFLSHEDPPYIPSEEVEVDSDLTSTRRSLRQGRKASRESTPADEVRILFKFPDHAKGAVTITSHDLERLQPGCYINDSIVDFYLKTLEEKSMWYDQPKCHFFNSFFYNRLVGASSGVDINYEDIKRWTNDVDIFEKRYLFIPICRSFHWSLIVVINPGNVSWWNHGDELHDRPALVYYDSLQSSQRPPFASRVRKYLKQECSSRKGTEVDFGSAKLNFVIPDVPKQDNEYDCGLYMMLYIDRFLRDAPSYDRRSSLDRRDWFTKADVLDFRCLLEHRFRSRMNFESALEESPMKEHVMLQWKAFQEERARIQAKFSKAKDC